MYIRIILTGLLVAVLHVSIHAQDITDKSDFLRIANYLSSGSGNWITPNPNFKANNKRSPKEFELRFTLDLKGNLLHIVHYTHWSNQSKVTSESYWFWHPGEQEIKYYSIDLDGDFTDGKTLAMDDETFGTFVYRYNTNGNIELRRDINIIKSENEHTVQSSVLRDGRWQVVADYNLRKSE